MPAFNLCADFTLYSANTPFPVHFMIAAFDFGQLGGPHFPQLLVNTTASERGLRFPQQGMNIILPVPEQTVRLRIGTFNGPVDIEAVDSLGTTVKTKSIPSLNTYVNTSIRAPEISAVNLTGGGNEAILVRICVTISTP